MASAVTTRLNHYERLGLRSDANEADIARAFAREISSFRPHAISDIAHITLAYETLRDPAKRRAYDASIASEPEPKQPEPEPTTRRDSWPFIASARIQSAELPAIDTLLRPASRTSIEAAEDPPAGPFVSPDRPRAAEVESRLGPSQRRRDDRSLQDLFEDRFRLVDDGHRDWKRPTMIVAGMFGGVALLGMGLGWYASRDIQPAQAKAAVAFPIPRKAIAQQPADAVVSPSAAAAAPEVRHERKTRTAATAPARGQHAPARETTAASEQQQRAEDIPDIPTEKVAALTAPIADTQTTATMPLSNGVIARTIGRIGYACGSVTSTTAVEGTAGVFKVTCSSGDSYRAAPVRGRYHFRRW
jgi:curved DNA-binding protein CbpA